MKNFSVKTADFDSLSISGESPIVQSDLGTAPNQIPLNKDLGSLAYMNAPQIEDLNVDTLELREIAAEMSETAVDVFVYDTRKDSDGGAWRSRTSHTSWYNEELNTATRGGRREFPAVAVIVAESNKVTIYDGDDPDLNMWMVFNQINYNGSSNTSCVAFLNGILVFGRNVGFPVWNFIKDREGIRTDSSLIYQTNVSLRNEASNGSILTTAGSPSIINNNINDVAMTVLPNAPIDSDTGLPIPTIAVATDGGISVIKDDGSVVDLNVGGRPYSSVYFSPDNLVWAVENPETNYDLLRYFEIPTGDITTANSYGPNSNPALSPSNTKGNFFDSFAYGSPVGLTKLDHNSSDVSKSLAAYTTSSYNTGWMPGDIKLATLSDTKNETVGVDETTELVTNGTFETVTDGNVGYDNGDGTVDGWGTIAGAELSIINNQLKVEHGTQNNSRATRAIQTIVGQQYVLSAKIIETNNSSNAGRIYFNDATGNSYAVDVSGGNTGIVEFTARHEETLVVLNSLSSGSGTYVIFDDISVKQTGELITNGTFDNGTWGWTNNGMATFEVSSAQAYSGTNSLHVVADSNSDHVYQNFPTEAGKTYVFTAAVYQATTGPYRIQIKDVSATYGELYTSFVDGVDVAIHNGTWRVFNATFTATGTTTQLLFAETTDTNACDLYIDAVSVRLAEDDRSVNNNGLQIFGEITKSPVAPGADLVAYSGFSANNYLVQPYNSDLDFGTGDFCVMGWFKRHSNSTVDRIWNRSDDVNNHRVEFYGLSTGDQVSFYTRDDSSYTHVVGTLPLNVWTHLVGIRESGTLKIYNNGILENSVTGDIRDLTSENNALLEVGKASFDGKVFDGSIALFKISATVPTDDQIAKIYRDEKVLFTDGAQATLYGTSDAVTALAYDDKTELLHVGTSGGRSDFAGLRRINNTTTAVTTSISASNNLIAEQ